MPDVLIVTVGGSPKPIITAVETLKPERVVFLCSGGKASSSSQVIGGGKPCKIYKSGKVEQELPNLPTCLNLGDRFVAERDMVLMEKLDDTADCYRVAVKTIEKLLREGDRRRISADYTGGTKSMSIGLALAAIDYDIPLFVTTASGRTNLDKVYFGEVTKIVAASAIEAERKMRRFLPVFLGQYNYPAAIAQLQDLLKTQVSDDAQMKIYNHLDYCKALDYWDKFDHNNAWRLLERFMGNAEVLPLGLFLKRVMASRGDIDRDYRPEARIKGHGYEIVEDLLLNADRRAAQNRFDDAAGRLYRALELLAQTHLKHAHQITTDNVDLRNVPDDLKARCEAMRDSKSEKIKVGLILGYEILASFPEDPLGALYRDRGKRILSGLEVRNASLLAHGFTPVTENRYREVKDAFVCFITDGIAAVAPSGKSPGPVQFPRGAQPW